MSLAGNSNFWVLLPGRKTLYPGLIIVTCWERTQPNVLQSINFTKDYTLYLFFTLVISLHNVVTLLEYQYCHYIIISSVRIYQIIKVC